MQGPPASEATTSSGSKSRAPSPPDAFSPIHLDLNNIKAGEARYEQPDYGTRTQDHRLPELETKHAGVTAMRRIFIGPSFQTHAPSLFGVSQRPKAHELHAIDSRSPRLPFGRRKRADTGVSRLSDESEAGHNKIKEGRHRSTSDARDGSLGWKGASFEIGGDIREAARRRDARLRRQREEAERASELPPPSPADRHSTTAVSQLRPPKSPALSSLTGASFVTAPSHLATSLASPTPSSGHPFQMYPPRADQDAGTATPTLSVPDIHITEPAPDGHASSPHRLRPDLPHLRSILRTRASTTASSPSFRSARSEPAPSPNVHFPGTAPSSSGTPVPGSGAAPPAPPEIVLARPSEEVPSAPKAGERFANVLHGHPIQAAKPAHRIRRAADEVIRQERMLVRVDWSPRDDLPDVFDEHVAKKYPTVKETWQELAVVWRASGQIELWNEHATASLLKRKKLESVIPLDSKATHLSLYSSTDLVFCLTFRPDVRSRVLARTTHTHARDDRSHAETTRRTNHSRSTKRGYLHLRSTGTNIFLFRARTHAIAKEWLWRLYRTLGGRLPPLLEVRVPGLDAKLYFRIPRDHDPDGDELYDRTEEDTGYRHLQADQVIEECIERLGTVSQWKDLVETAKRQGTSFRLAWRRGSILDWITDPPPGEASPDWAVIGGFAFRQAGSIPVLELRPASHYPTTCRVPSKAGVSDSHISSTVRIAEPPGIEGFAIRVTPKGRTQRVYLTTRTNLLFRCRPTAAHAPEPPLEMMDANNNPAAVVLRPFIVGMASLAQPDKKKREKLWSPISRSVLRDHAHEQRRRRDRALQNMSVAELADEAFGKPLSAEELNGTAAECDGNAMLEYLETMEKKRSFLQVMDAQGYVQLSEIVSVEPEVETPTDAQVQDDSKDLSRKLRTVIVDFDSVRSVKLVCPSTEVRDEWILRLRALATYWRRRERVNAIQHMELSGADAMINRLSTRGAQRRHAYEEDADACTEPPLSRDEVLSSPHLTHLYNWCMLEGCRAILREGVMHVKQGLRGIYHKRHVVLLPGILLEFDHAARDINGQPLPSPYHRRRSVLHLRDCYVYSGTLADHLNAPTATTGEWDPADETEHQFPRCYPTTDGLRTSDERDDCTFVIYKIKHSKSGVDCKLGQKGKSKNARVFRTRSKIERDLFVYALNLSIERVLRGEKDREDKLRDFSWLSKVK
ncbi:hypothetical protein JCM10908_000988 [Rhodotorula pacifica]|uniref:Spo71p n=1 Tax=Rhodotorula pacifica TaxID=1495444 RepID=UPI00317684E8